MESFTVEEGDAKQRIDRLLASKYPEQSRQYFQSIMDGHVFVDGKTVKKRHLCMPGERIEIDFVLSDEISLEPEDIPLDILYEDAFVIAVNKPAGLVVHPGPGNWTGTFVNALLHHCKSLETDGSLRPGIVHRLDKDTSGVLIAAKTREAHRGLVESFSKRRALKCYLAVCSKKIEKQTVTGSIGRHPQRRKEMCVSESGKEAETTFIPLCHSGDKALVLAFPKTGRTHQIRVHLSHLNAPIIGDSTYGCQKRVRMHLHAYKLRLPHPITNEPLELIAPLPHDIRRTLNGIDPDWEELVQCASSFNA